MKHNYDVIIVGAGSVGVPAAMALGEMGVKTLVLDRHPSPGQGENKHAIGGARATHSDPAKIQVCLRSLEIFSSWEETHGDPVEWLKGGYAFPVYRKTEEDILKGILPIQKKYGLNIDYVGPQEMRTIIPGMNPEGLMGGTYSPDDGTVSPLLALNAFYRRTLSLGVRFRFNEQVERILTEKGRVVGVATQRETHRAPVVIDAAGPYSRELCRSVGVDIPVTPDSHEGAITEPVEPFFKCLVVDLRPAPGTSNYYFYQNRHGQVIFCITPHPPFVGTDKRETSFFLPQVTARMVRLLPRLKNLRVRRVWRGLYPMSPDGSPLVGWCRDVEGLLHATGMCGQGFMLGPGLGEVLARLVTEKTSEKDRIVLDGFDVTRKFKGVEALK